MLVSFSVSNFLSFKGSQTLRMDAVSDGKDDINPQNTFAVAPGSKARLLKSALLFGANASGKSNFISAFAVFRDILLRSQAVLEENASPVRRVTPFLLDKQSLQQPSVIEVVLIEAGVRYRYGLELQAGHVTGEWLFYTPKTRETMLFKREAQQLEFNKEGFAEATPFVKNGVAQLTRDNVPFVSVLASHNGTHCLALVRWVNRLAVITGADEQGYMGFTVDLMKKDAIFKAWLLSILRHFQIDNISVVEVDKKSLELVVSKKIQTDEGEQNVDFPLSFESEGTKKLIHLLGPIYDSIQNKRILIIDEVEAKFHSLLTRYLFRIYHQKNETGSQIIAAAHDTSLMDTRDFRRDQIWFMEKNAQGSSVIYSLVEFKEKARQLKLQYGPDYLAGAFGAVSLFENLTQVDEVM